MRCPYCSADKESLKVIDSRGCDGGASIRRRRECLACHKRFTTYERVEQTRRLSVIKKDGRRMPWEREKLQTGLERACYKRQVSQEAISHAVDDIEEEIFTRFDREVPSEQIGQLVSNTLRRMDQVAYVRFASVYRQFKTLDELVTEAQAVISAKRYEDPTQGVLFLESTNGAPKAATDQAKPDLADRDRAKRPKANSTDK